MYKCQELIGRGSYGTVYKGVHAKTGAIVAIKVLNLDSTPEEVRDFQREIALLTELRHSAESSSASTTSPHPHHRPHPHHSGAPLNLVKYHNSYVSGTKLCIVMDYCAGGSVRSLMGSAGIPERWIAVIARETLLALQFIHSLGIIHRDIKAANILLTRDGHVQICDFGVAAQLQCASSKRSTVIGTPYWMAPEVISGDPYNSKADIWSFGITCYEMATGNPPHADMDPMRAVCLITRSGPPQLSSHSVSSAFRYFVASCLEEQSNERPDAGELLGQRWIKDNMHLKTGILTALIERDALAKKIAGSSSNNNNNNNSQKDPQNNNSQKDLPYVGVDKNDATPQNMPEWQFDTIKSNGHNAFLEACDNLNLGSSYENDPLTTEFETLKANHRQVADQIPIEVQTDSHDPYFGQGNFTPHNEPKKHELVSLFDNGDDDDDDYNSSKQELAQMLSRKTSAIEIPPAFPSTSSTSTLSLARTNTNTNIEINMDSFNLRAMKQTSGREQKQSIETENPCFWSGQTKSQDTTGLETNGSNGSKAYPVKVVVHPNNNSMQTIDNSNYESVQPSYLAVGQYNTPVKTTTPATKQTSDTSHQIAARNSPKLLNASLSVNALTPDAHLRDASGRVTPSLHQKDARHDRLFNINSPSLNATRDSDTSTDSNKLMNKQNLGLLGQEKLSLQAMRDGPFLPPSPGKSRNVKRYSGQISHHHGGHSGSMGSGGSACSVASTTTATTPPLHAHSSEPETIGNDVINASIYGFPLLEDTSIAHVFTLDSDALFSSIDQILDKLDQGLGAISSRLKTYV